MNDALPPEDEPREGFGGAVPIPESEDLRDSIDTDAEQKEAEAEDDYDDEISDEKWEELERFGDWYKRVRDAVSSAPIVDSYEGSELRDGVATRLTQFVTAFGYDDKSNSPTDPDPDWRGVNEILSKLHDADLLADYIDLIGDADGGQMAKARFGTTLAELPELQRIALLNAGLAG